MAQQTGQANTTTNHNTIKKWVEGRGGKPAQAIGTETEGGSDNTEDQFSRQIRRKS